MSLQKEPTQHGRWKDGDFDLISSDGVKLCIQTYHLQSASRVFCDMIESGSGLKRIELDDTSTTIGQFLDLVTTGSTSFASQEQPSPDYPQSVSLVQFLRKYECEAAIGYLKQFIRTPAPSGSDSINNHRMLAAMHLDLPDICAELLRTEPKLFKWLHPAPDKLSVPPRLQFDIYRHIPHRYLWALMAAGVSNAEWVRVWRHSEGIYAHLSPAERFLDFLGTV